MSHRLVIILLFFYHFMQHPKDKNSGLVSQATAV